MIIVGAVFAALLVVLVLALVVVVSAVAAEFAGKVRFVGWLLTAAVSLYFLMVQARLIGSLYVQRQERIGWS